MNAEPTIIIRLDGDSDIARPGEPLSGSYWIESLAADQVKAIETSILWHTEGKGDEDMAVHEFWRRDVDDGCRIEPDRPEHFVTTLPNSPLSYEGRIVKIRWCVRVRVFLQRGRDFSSQKVFSLGNVPAVRVPAADASEDEAARG
jgi:hypothetical protein